MIQRVVAALLLPLFVCTIASAQSLRASASQAASQSAATWQQDYDHALSRRDSGKKKVWIGAGISVASILLGLTSGSQVDGCLADVVNGTKTLATGEQCGSSNARLSVWGSIGGSAVFTWGLIEWNDAKQDIRALEARRPSHSQSAIFALGDHHAIGVAIGSTSRVTYRVSW